jgi:hypothetical protein
MWKGITKEVGFPKTAMSLVFNLNDSFKLFTDQHFTQATRTTKNIGLQGFKHNQRMWKVMAKVKWL